MDELLKTIDNEIAHFVSTNAPGTIEYLLAVLTFYKQFYYKLSINQLDESKLQEALSAVIACAHNKSNFAKYIDTNILSLGGGVTPQVKNDIINTLVDTGKSILAFMPDLINIGMTKLRNKIGRTEIYDQVMNDIHHSFNSTEKEYYDDLRKRITLYKTLCDNDYLFYNHRDNYDKHFLPLVHQVLSYPSNVKLSESEFRSRLSKLDPKITKKILLNRQIELDFAIMAWQLSFEKQVSYDDIRVITEYQLLKRIAIKNGYKFNESEWQ